MTVVNENVHEFPSRAQLKEARAVLAEASARHLTLRLMGGIGILARCPSAAHAPLAREYNDIDFFGRGRDSAGLISMFVELGYASERRFNSLHGHRRLLFKASDGQHRDVLLDHFEMCHKLDLRNRLEVESETLPLADLLITKLQVVEANPKDLADTLALLTDHAVAEGPDAIDGGYIARVCARDWGLYKTLTIGVQRVGEYADQIAFDGRDTVHRHLAALANRIEQEPKSIRWKARAKIGERVTWYELPEEVG